MFPPENILMHLAATAPFCQDPKTNEVSLLTKKN